MTVNPLIITVRGWPVALMVEIQNERITLPLITGGVGGQLVKFLFWLVGAARGRKAFAESS